MLRSTCADWWPGSGAWHPTCHSERGARRRCGAASTPAAVANADGHSLGGIGRAGERRTAVGAGRHTPPSMAATMCSDSRSVAWAASHTSRRTSPEPSAARTRGLLTAARRPPRGTVVGSAPWWYARRLRSCRPFGRLLGTSWPGMQHTEADHHRRGRQALPHRRPEHRQLSGSDLRQPAGQLQTGQLDQPDPSTGYRTTPELTERGGPRPCGLPRSVRTSPW
jgi:hypothetical protein